MLTVPGQSVTWPFDGGRVVVADDGTLELRVEGLGSVRLGVAGARLTPVLVEEDVAEHEGSVAGMGLGQRVMTGEHCQLRWVIEVPEDLDDARLELQVEPGERQAAWLWPSGADGLLAVVPTSGAGPVLALHAVQAEVRAAEPQAASPASPNPPDEPGETGGADTPGFGHPGGGRDSDSPQPGVLRLVVTPQQLGAGRHVVILRVLVMPALITVATLLPAWFEPLTLDEGEDWVAPLADLGVDCEPPVELSFTEQAAEVRLTAPAGRHRVGVHGRRGVTDLVFEVAPPIASLLGELAARLLDEAGMDGAAAFVLHRALVSGAIPRSPSIEDALDRFDWSSKPGALAVAFGSERALADGEAAMAREAQRRCADLPTGPGRPRVRSLAWLVASALGVDAAPAVVDDDPAGEGLEVDLALGRRTPQATVGLAAAINALGAGLPGLPVGLEPVEQALLVGLLESCPEDWPEAPLAGFTAQTARRRLLASYAAGELTDPAPLAWLLVYG